MYVQYGYTFEGTIVVRAGAMRKLSIINNIYSNIHSHAPIIYENLKGGFL